MTSRENDLYDIKMNIITSICLQACRVTYKMHICKLHFLLNSYYLLTFVESGDG